MGLEVGIVVVLLEEWRVVIERGHKGALRGAGVLVLDLLVGDKGMFALWSYTELCTYLNVFYLHKNAN